MRTSISTQAASDYRVLARQIRDAGLLDRRPALYIARMLLIIGALSAGWVALFAVGDSWAALGIAPLLAFLFTQVDFVGHDAGHQQIFESRRANQFVGLIAGNLLTGLSFGWWVPKHNAHHAHPNVVDRDPDIGAGALALTFTADIARGRRGAGGSWPGTRRGCSFHSFCSRVPGCTSRDSTPSLDGGIGPQPSKDYSS